MADPEEMQYEEAQVATDAGFFFRNLGELCLSSFSSIESSTAHTGNSCKLAVSAKYGATFFTDSRGFFAAYTADLLKAAVKWTRDTEAQPPTEPSSVCRAVSQAPATALVLSPDELFLAECSSTAIRVHSVQALVEDGSTDALWVWELPEDVEFKQAQWRPQVSSDEVPECIIVTTGSVLSAKLFEKPGEVEGIGGEVAAAQWSADGSALAYAQKHKVIIRDVAKGEEFITALAQEHLTVSAPEVREESHLLVDSLHWAGSTAILAFGVFVATEDDQEEEEPIVAATSIEWSPRDAQQGGPPEQCTMSEFNFIVVDAEATAPRSGPYVRVASVPAWRMWLAAHVKSSDDHIRIYEDHEDEGVREVEMSENRIMIPNQPGDEQNYVVGIGIDLTSTQIQVENPQEGENLPDLPPMPVLIIATSDGKLRFYTCGHLSKPTTQLVHAAEQIPATLESSFVATGDVTAGGAPGGSGTVEVEKGAAVALPSEDEWDESEEETSEEEAEREVERTPEKLAERRPVPESLSKPSFKPQQQPLGQGGFNWQPADSSAQPASTTSFGQSAFSGLSSFGSRMFGAPAAAAPPASAKSLFGSARSTAASSSAAPAAGLPAFGAPQAPAKASQEQKPKPSAAVGTQRGAAAMPQVPRVSEEPRPVTAARQQAKQVQQPRPQLEGEGAEIKEIEADFLKSLFATRRLQAEMEDRLQQVKEQDAPRIQEVQESLVRLKSGLKGMQTQVGAQQREVARLTKVLLASEQRRDALREGWVAAAAREQPQGDASALGRLQAAQELAPGLRELRDSMQAQAELLMRKVAELDTCLEDLEERERWQARAGGAPRQTSQQVYNSVNAQGAAVRGQLARINELLDRMADMGIMEDSDTAGDGNVGEGGAAGAAAGADGSWAASARWPARGSSSAGPPASSVGTPKPRISPWRPVRETGLSPPLQLASERHQGKASAHQASAAAASPWLGPDADALRQAILAKAASGEHTTRVTVALPPPSLPEAPSTQAISLATSPSSPPAPSTLAMTRQRSSTPPGEQTPFSFNLPPSTGGFGASSGQGLSFNTPMQRPDKRATSPARPRHAQEAQARPTAPNPSPATFPASPFAVPTPQPPLPSSKMQGTAQAFGAAFAGGSKAGAKPAAPMPTPALHGAQSTPNLPSAAEAGAPVAKAAAKPVAKQPPVPSFGQVQAARVQAQAALAAAQGVGKRPQQQQPMPAMAHLDSARLPEEPTPSEARSEASAKRGADDRPLPAAAAAGQAAAGRSKVAVKKAAAGQPPVPSMQQMQQAQAMAAQARAKAQQKQRDDAGASAAAASQLPSSSTASATASSGGLARAGSTAEPLPAQASEEAGATAAPPRLSAAAKQPPLPSMAQLRSAQALAAKAPGVAAPAQPKPQPSHDHSRLKRSPSREAQPPLPSLQDLQAAQALGSSPHQQQGKAAKTSAPPSAFPTSSTFTPAFSFSGFGAPASGAPASTGFSFAPPTAASPAAPLSFGLGVPASVPASAPPASVPAPTVSLAPPTLAPAPPATTAVSTAAAPSAPSPFAAPAAAPEPSSPVASIGFAFPAASAAGSPPAAGGLFGTTAATPGSAGGVAATPGAAPASPTTISAFGTSHTPPSPSTSAAGSPFATPAPATAPAPAAVTSFPPAAAVAPTPAASTAPSLFGASFGAPAQLGTGSPFGASFGAPAQVGAAASPFGGMTASALGGGFGASTASSSPAAATPPAAFPSAFGAPAGPSPFVAQASASQSQSAASPFGMGTSQAAPAFGALNSLATAAAASPFGTVSAPAATASPFGGVASSLGSFGLGGSAASSSSAAAPAASPFGRGLFDAPTSSPAGGSPGASTGGGFFQQAASSVSAFGTPAPAVPPTGSVFGSAAASSGPAASPFGGGFGQPSALGASAFNKPVAGFGQTSPVGFGAPATPGFGTPATPGFGTPAVPGFGSPAGVGAFGQPAATSAFGGSASGSGFGAFAAQGGGFAALGQGGGFGGFGGAGGGGGFGALNAGGGMFGNASSPTPPANTNSAAWQPRK